MRDRTRDATGSLVYEALDCMKPAEIKRAVSALQGSLEAKADASSAASQKAYMKSELSFHGVSSAVIRDTARGFLQAHSDLDRESLHVLVRALFDSEWFDLRSVALALLERRIKQLDAEDLPLMIELVRASACWAHVDWLATKMIPAVMDDHPKRVSLLKRWAKDEDFWVRRTALLVQMQNIKYADGDFDLFTALAVPMLPEKELFIRKAIGWVLREVSKKKPALVRDFVRKYGDSMSGLTRREATKYLD